MWWYGGAWCLVVVLLLWAAAYRAARESSSRWLTATLLLMGTAMALTPLIYEFPAEKGSVTIRVVEVAKNGAYRDCPWGAFEFPNDDRRVFNVYEAFVATRNVTPITDNPKARRISYTVSVYMERPNVFFLAKPERWDTRNPAEVRQEVQKATEYWLYVFNNEHSKELATFYNPLDDDQVAKFRELLGSWLDEKLAAEGLKVRRDEVTFTVDD